MLPNLVVIGARKGGTTSLYHYLRHHPEVTMSREKELRFFVRPERWRLGPDWYAGHFADARTPIRGEVSPQYTAYPREPRVAERMHSILPDTKLIYMVRDPIERIVSAYVARYAEREEHEPFAETVLSDGKGLYVNESSYHMQLERYLRHYSLERILIISQEELLRARRRTLRTIFRFLGVNPSFDSPRFDHMSNHWSHLRRVRGPRWLSVGPNPKATGRLPWKVRARVKRALYRPLSRRVDRPVIDPAVREALAERLSPDVERLRRLTGRSFEEWSI
ncbi:MAG: sulfotransferase domain-containing protein [Solirubrobacterales bacterium]